MPGRELLLFGLPQFPRPIEQQPVGQFVTVYADDARAAVMW